MTHVYLDWNVFNKIEKGDNPIFSRIEQLILDNKIVTPYSNAHINDLVRGYDKNTDYITGHLSTLQRLTHDLCIVQYWGEKSVRWHYREVAEFFNAAIEDIGTGAKSFCDLFSSFEDDVPGAAALWEIQLSLLRFQKLPDTFMDIFRANPVFNIMFPKSKVEMNMLALSEDIFDFSFNAKKDYSLYKTLRNYVNQNRTKVKEQAEMFRNIDKSMAGIPSHLNLDNAWENYSSKTKITDNPAYQKITDTYCKIDFKGYKSDDRFSNMIDDSLHVFYGANCNYFVTIDDKCYHKAIETYKQLKIETKALKPEEFIQEFASL